ncbi:MAG: amino acid adenylation domain-containing protein [Bacteriovoracaceae bacterium]|nr:amino acid adenylation domain-containing protein [Bacteriovoracaceae bacterium]
MRKSSLLHEIFEKAACKHPENIAIEIPPSSEFQERRQFTYEEINNLANALAHKISTFVSSESVVAIMLPRNSHHAYVAQLAVLKAGAAYTCIDTSFPGERARFIVQDSKAVLLLGSFEFFHFFDSKLISNDRMIDVIQWEKKKEMRPAFKSPSWVSKESLAYVIYTSGTTGKPKGVMIEHHSIVNLVLSDITYFNLNPNDRAAQTSSTSYDSSIEEIWLAFGAGATMVVVNDEVIRLGPDFGPWLKREKISVLCPPPTLLRMGICENPQKDLPDLRLLYVGGEALPAEVVERWGPGRWLENGYGPTECTVTVTRCRVHCDKKITIGKPVVNNSAWVLDENLTEVPHGNSGELCIGGAGLAREYLGSPELTSEKFIEHPTFGRIYRTGDLVRLLDSNELEYLGRIDLQVKLRGYRIELGDIESVLCKCIGVKDAACKVQDMETGQALVACIISQDVQKLDVPQIRRQLEEQLPKYMIPAYFMTMDVFPVIASSGKLDRKALPDYKKENICDNRKIIAPRNEVEKIIASKIKEALDRSGSTEISVEDNFFDIGGDSLSAAITVSKLRENEKTSMLTVRDIYETPTISGLAEKTKCQTIKKNVVKQSQHPSENKNDSAIFVSVVQLLFILSGIVVGGCVGFFIMFHIFPFLLNALGIVKFCLIMPVLFLIALFLRILLSIPFVMVIKKILIGKYKPGRHPVWGGMYLRNWILCQSVRLVPMGMFDGTEFKNMFLRLLGVKIGKNVFIHKGVNILAGGWDLIEIGDNATIGRESAVRALDFYNGEMIFGTIKIGKNCTIETRASVTTNTIMEDESSLTSLSMLPSGKTILKGEVWEGVPAVYKKKSQNPPEAEDKDSEMSPLRHGISLILHRTLMGTVTSLPVPIIILGVIFYLGVDAQSLLQWLFYSGIDSSLIAIICAYTVFASVMCLLVQALFARALGKIKPGNYSRFGRKFIHIWLKDRLVELAGNRLSGAMYWPFWLRLAGMKIGKNCEISTIIDVVPELVTISDEVFFADGIYLGGPEIHRGVVSCDEIKLSQNTFIGNHAIIPPGSKLPSDILLGICTVADKDKITEGSSWFGHPSFKLPNREVVEMDRKLTHNPAWYRYVTRIFWETLRFFLPVVPTVFFLFWIKTLSYFSAVQSPQLFWSLTLNLSTIIFLLVMASLIFVMKWVLLGKVREGVHPLWSCWCSRWDFLYVAWASYARNILVLFEGTLFLGHWLRLMGARIGKRVVLGAGFSQVVDPDMLDFDDYSTVLCMFQAHSFEDRVLKIAPVKINKRSTVGNAAVLLYGADIGEMASVTDNSVVMKRERLLPFNHYSGCPTRTIELTH